jgi:circadian clock protein KaiB
VKLIQVKSAENSQNCFAENILFWHIKRKPRRMSARKPPTLENRSWDLSLFIAGRSHPKSVAAYSNLKRICEEHLTGDYQLQVIDVSVSPEIAATEQVLAIPMLVRKVPQPHRRIVGDLSDTDRVLVCLGVSALK